VHSLVQIVADVADDGRTVLARLHARGQLAVRCTAPGTVHLVGTAAGPLGGDVLEISVVVRAGADLTVAAVAATLALPGRPAGWAESVLDLQVQDGAHLHHALPPLVVCRQAQLRTMTRLAVTGSGSAEVVDQVVFGRHGEDGGDWVGRIVADHDGAPVLRSTHRSTLLRATSTAHAAAEMRALVSRLRTGPGVRGTAATSGGAVACPLAAGGTVVTAVGPDLATALSDAGLADQRAVVTADGRALTDRGRPAGRVEVPPGSAAPGW
jgi:urease accessory protein